ncbi:MAG: ParB/RepB/Spo0J family partition protein [Armatimonadota bacterium]
MSDSTQIPGISSILNLEIEKIRLNPNQPRKYFDHDKLDELAQSIMQNGIIEPIIVRPTKDGAYELVAGERRYRASIQAGLRRIPAVCRILDDRKAMEIALIENIQREDINPVECAMAYRHLIDDYGMTQELVADRVGKRRSTVANTLRLLNLPHDILDSLDKGDITEGHARALLSVSDIKRQIEVWQQIVNRGMSVRDAEKASKLPAHTKSADADVSRETFSTTKLDPDLKDVEDKLRRFLGTKVTISRTKSSNGKIDIEFYDDDDLMRILEIIAQI